MFAFFVYVCLPVFTVTVIRRRKFHIHIYFNVAVTEQCMLSISHRCSGLCFFRFYCCNVDVVNTARLRLAMLSFWCTDTSGSLSPSSSMQSMSKSQPQSITGSLSPSSSTQSLSRSQSQSTGEFYWRSDLLICHIKCCISQDARLNRCHEVCHKIWH